MDKSKEYILMCEKAEEIQELRKSYIQALVGDFYYVQMDKGCFVFNEDTIGGHYCENCCSQDGNAGDDSKWFRRYCIWLPRQDQLQEMIESENDEFKLESLHRETINLNYTSAGTCLNYSMEQLWLAFVMKKKYGKEWNGKEWRKSDT